MKKMNELKQLKTCPKCNLKFHSIYIIISYDIDVNTGNYKRKWKMIGKICKNRHYYIDNNTFDYSSYHFKTPIDTRVFYVKTFNNKKQSFLRLGFIFYYEVFFDDLYFRFNPIYKLYYKKEKKIFFNYPIEIYRELV